MYETYDRKVSKIEAGQTSTLAARTFQWITAAIRPLSLHEVREAVAFDQDDTCWNTDKLPHPDKIIGSCQNLVILLDDGKLCFAHHTVRGFLLSRKSRTLWSPLSFDLETAKTHAAMVCVAYLCFDDFEAQIVHRPQEIVQSTGSINSGGLLNLTRTLGISGRWFNLPYRLLGGSPRYLPTPIGVKWTAPSPKSAVAPTLTEKYKLLDYAIRNWLTHTKVLTPTDNADTNYKMWDYHENFRYLAINGIYTTWTQFSSLALDRVMAFDHCSWTSRSNYNDLPFDAMFRWALENAHVPLLTLLEVPPRGPPLNVYLRRYLTNGQDILRTPCIKGEIELLDFLVEYCNRIKMEFIDFCHEEHLSWCASLNGHTSIVKLLIREGISVNAQTERLQYAPNIDGFRLSTAIQLAVFNGHNEIVDVLLRNGADIDQWNELGLHPLHYAPNTEILRLLLRKGADINVKAVDDFGAEDKSVPAHSENQILSTHTAAGETRLISAASNGDSDVVKLLCDRGASTAVKDREGRTALHRACISGHVETVRVLIANTSQQVISRDNRNMTPLDHAVASRNVDVASILVQAGAQDTSFTVGELQDAAVRGDAKTVDLLLGLGVPADSWNHEKKKNCIATCC